MPDFDWFPELDDLAAPLTLRLHYAEIGGRQEVVGLEVWTADRKGSRPGDQLLRFSEDPDEQARGLQTRDLMAVARIFRRRARAELQPQAIPRASRPAKPSGRGHPYSLDDMRRAVDIFDTARRYQRPGAKAVAEAFGITHKAAEGLVQRSRKRLAEDAR